MNIYEPSILGKNKKPLCGIRNQDFTTSGACLTTSPALAKPVPCPYRPQTDATKGHHAPWQYSLIPLKGHPTQWHGTRRDQATTHQSDPWQPGKVPGKSGTAIQCIRQLRSGRTDSLPPRK